MRLLNVHTRKLEFFPSASDEPYAILSHRWGKEEVTFNDIQGDYYTSMAGYKKIDYTCQEAAQDGYGYTWIDSCCIDKSSSAELSEAINSMFSWYASARVCYVYLADVTDVEGDMSSSAWFTRAWTLQELIAPVRVYFYNYRWQKLGDRDCLGHIIAKTTNIDIKVFSSSHPNEFSVATRMSWAAHRQATRDEDIAYSLLGIFDIQMPLLYGEGSAKAFRRLQEEIIKSSNDQSIFAWGFKETNVSEGLALYRPTLALAAWPYAFRNCRNINRIENHDNFFISNNGIQIDLPTHQIRLTNSKQIFWIALLACVLKSDGIYSLGMVLHDSDLQPWICPSDSKLRRSRYSRTIVSDSGGNSQAATVIVPISAIYQCTPQSFLLVSNFDNIYRSNVHDSDVKSPWPEIYIKIIASMSPSQTVTVLPRSKWEKIDAPTSPQPIYRLVRAGNRGDMPQQEVVVVMFAHRAYPDEHCTVTLYFNSTYPTHDRLGMYVDEYEGQIDAMEPVVTKYWFDERTWTLGEQQTSEGPIIQYYRNMEGNSKLKHLSGDRTVSLESRAHFNNFLITLSTSVTPGVNRAEDLKVVDRYKYTYREFGK
jgi:Heterokaryon incompatibility protein (HET)